MKFIIIFLGLTFQLNAQVKVFNSTGFDMEIIFGNKSFELKPDEYFSIPSHGTVVLEWKFKTINELSYEGLGYQYCPTRLGKNHFKIVIDNGGDNKILAFKKPKIIRA